MPLPPSAQPRSAGLPPPAAMIAQGALVFANHSGGKDSQAMLIHLVEHLEVRLDQLVVIHADLGEAEWEGSAEHAAADAERYGLPFRVARAVDAGGEAKQLLDYADKRGKFPSKGQRWCTSDWKRGPLRKLINQIRDERDHRSPFVLNAMGMRAEESIERSKLEELAYVETASCPTGPLGATLSWPTRGRRRAFFDWHPILDWSEQQVFQTIAAAGATPHWAYAAGARRLSCLVCIFSSEPDIRAAVAASAKGRAYARRIIEIERRHGQTLLPPRPAKPGGQLRQRFLEEVVGDLL